MALLVVPKSSPITGGILVVSHRWCWFGYKVKLRDSLMRQTIVGLATVVVGSAIIIFSERLAGVTAALHRRTLGIELPRGWNRGGAVFVGVLMSFYGLLVLLRLVTIK